MARCSKIVQMDKFLLTNNDCKLPSSFFRDVKKLPIELHTQIKNIIDTFDAAASLREIPDIKKLKGHQTAYRVKLNHYRLCFYFENGEATLVRFLHRNEVYRSFPQLAITLPLNHHPFILITLGIS